MSFRRAINEKCRDCIYDPKSGLGTWRQQVEGCVIQSCSLWPYRPKSSAGRSSAVDLAHPQTEEGVAATHAPPQHEFAGEEPV